jgi:hypothetical protein
MKRNQRVIPKSMSSTPIGDGNRFPAFAKPASAGEARSDKITRYEGIRWPNRRNRRWSTTS